MSAAATYGPYGPATSASPAAAPRRKAKRASNSLFSPLWLAPLPITLLILAICAPPEASLFIGSLRLMMHRVVLVIFTIPALLILLQSKGLRFKLFDALFLAYNAWILLVFMVHLGPMDGLQFGGSLILESLGAYVVARAYIRTLEQYEAAIGVLLLTIGMVGLLAAPEAILRSHFIHQWMGPLTGINIVIYDEVRRGLLRAAATFEHPILYGAYTSSIVAMVWFSAAREKQRWRNLGLMTGATIFAMSSAPLNAIVIQGLLGWMNKLTRGFPYRGAILGSAALIGYILISLLTGRSPFAFIAMNIALDPSTAYHRVLIWTYGVASVENHWLFGLGLGDWVRPAWMHSASVDAFWLLIPMRAGVPSIVLLCAASWMLFAAVNAKRKGRERAVRKAALGWSISFVAVAFTGFTVHYWDALHAYFFLLLGMGAWLGDLPKQHRPKPAAPSTAPGGRSADAASAMNSARG
jgi:hypothetical protein